MGNRYNQFDPSLVPIGTFPEPQAPPVPDRSQEREISAEVRIRHRVEARRVLHLGFDQTVVLFDYVINPFTAVGPDVVVVLSYTVPEGRVLEVQRVSVQFDEPWLHSTDLIGWRPVVSNGQLPTVGNLTGAVSGYFTSPLGSFHNPVTLHPFVVQTNNVVAVVVYRADTNVTYAMTATAWIIGRLHSPQSEGG